LPGSIRTTGGDTGSGALLASGDCLGSPSSTRTCTGRAPTLFSLTATSRCCAGWITRVGDVVRWSDDDATVVVVIA